MFRKVLLPTTILLLTLFAWPHRAPTRDAAREAVIEQQLTALNSALLEPFRKAAVAFDRDDFAEAAAQLTPVVEAAPSFDPAPRPPPSPFPRGPSDRPVPL